MVSTSIFFLPIHNIACDKNEAKLLHITKYIQLYYILPQSTLSSMKERKKISMSSVFKNICNK